MSGFEEKKTKFRYEPEDLEPRDQAAEEAALDAWIARNKDALIESIKESDAEEARGEGYTWDEVMAAIEARRKERRAKTQK